MAVSPPSVPKRVIRAVPLAGAAFVSADGNQRAAAISYRVLFSLVPFVAVLVSVLELVFPATTEARIMSWLVNSLQLPPELDESVESVVADAGLPASVVGLISLGILLWGASGMMGAIRSAFRAIWHAETARPYVRAKLLDAALVVAAGVLVVSAFGLTVIGQALTRIGSEIAEALGKDDPGRFLGTSTEVAISGAVVFVAFVVLYRTMPPVHVNVSETIAGALISTAGVLLATGGFSFYLTHFAGFDDIYGPLGAILVFLYLVYVLAAVLLFGACVTAAWPDTVAPAPPGPKIPFGTRIVGLLRSLVLPERRHVEDDR